MQGTALDDTVREAMIIGTPLMPAIIFVCLLTSRRMLALREGGGGIRGRRERKGIGAWRIGRGDREKKGSIEARKKWIKNGNEGEDGKNL